MHPSQNSFALTTFVVLKVKCETYFGLVLVGSSRYNYLVIFGLYLLGVALSILMAKLFNRFVVHGESSPFVMELPPYRLPSAKSVFRHTWEKGKQYLHKMGTIILLASIVVWGLSYFPQQQEGMTREQHMEQYPPLPNWN